MIRQAEKRDLPSLAALFRQLHAHHVRIKPESFRMPEDSWFSERVGAILNDGEMTVLVSVGEEGDLNGYAAVRIMTVDSAERIPRKMCYIDCFAVAEGARRKGIGTALFDAVKAFARKNGCGSVQLGVTAVNADAVRFYEKMGLVPRTIQMEIQSVEKEK